MDFNLSSEQKKLVASFRAFGTEVFTPDHVSQWCKDQGLPDDVMKRFVDTYYKFSDKESTSAAGHSLLDQALIIEELSRCAGATLPFQNDLFNLQIVDALSEAGNVDSAVADYRETGRLMFALAISEPDGGSDVMSMKTSTRTLDGKIVLNGRKSYVNNGEYAPYIVVAAIDADAQTDDSYPALALWLVPRNLKGIAAVPIDKIGQDMLPFASLSFQDVELKPEYRISAEHGDFRRLFQMLEYGRVLLCASSLGMAQAAMEDACAHARSRKAFGVQVGRFQQIETMLTDMELRLTNMRSILYRAAWAVDKGDSERRLAVALMKRYIPETSVEVASDAMQILGGLGYTESSRTCRVWRDCRGNQIAEGTDQIMVYIAAPLIVEKYRDF
ncbi:acyl-CoA dehydrogenase family protein [Senegalimassilia faecalis]|uniref:Acyl-CoA dehydrogenase n=1 Tax=Senegalimassilia faecalis TaxID=2509433 RepID=A0A4Q2JYB5_9ACTN|nr:acyl-CoA dehydrogenase family protein [Senegalimassilia faecalis]RXZ53068.1 acyl-CoA dehydrogenase [Senegalimassilia faecalis]